MLRAVDDLDGTSFADHVDTFSINGKNYVIDLCEDNHRRLLAALEEFVAHAREDDPRAPKAPKAATTKRVKEQPKPKEVVAAVQATPVMALGQLDFEEPPPPKPAPSRNAPSSPYLTQRVRKERQREIRAWARAHGFKVGDRGVIPQDAVTAYQAAHTK